MEPNKLEKHIKKQFHEREIEPSKEAWQSLSEQLANNTPQTKKTAAFWYGIAASVIGLLMISVFFLNSKGQVKTPIKVVNVEKKSPINEVEKVSELNTVNSQSTLESKEEREILVKKDILKEEEFFEKPNQIIIVEDLQRVEQPLNNSVVVVAREDLIIEEKINEVLATVISLENEVYQISDTEVDSLLRLAQEEILNEEIFEKNGRVDAMALLTEVEDELDQSFREKIFTKLKEGLFKARTAVADRNN